MNTLNYQMLSNSLIEGLTNNTAFGTHTPTKILSEFLGVTSSPGRTSKDIYTSHLVAFKHYMVETEMQEKYTWVLNSEGTAYVKEPVLDENGDPVQWERIKRDENGQLMQVLRTGHVDSITGTPNVSTVTEAEAEALENIIFQYFPEIRTMERRARQNELWRLGFRVEAGGTFGVNPFTSWATYEPDPIKPVLSSEIEIA